MTANANEVTILIAEDDDGHARLIKRNLVRAGLNNPILRFADGQEVLDYLFDRLPGQRFEPCRPHLLLLDIRMPKVDGVDVLLQIKADPSLKKMPVIMLTTTDDPREISRCHELGCSHYLVKPVAYERLAEVIKHLGMFISLVKVPDIDAGAGGKEP